MRNLPNMKGQLSHKRAVAYFIALLYPVTIGSSLYYALKGPSPNFHVRNRSRINIMDKSEEVQKKRQNIIDQVNNTYNSRPDRYTEFIYDQDATFEDPLIYVRGKNGIAAVIYGLPSVLREFKADCKEIEHYEDAIVIKQNLTLQIGVYYRNTFPCTQLLLLNEENDRIKEHVDMWGDKPLFEFNGVTKAFKWMNGKAARVICGLPSGRLID